MVVEHDAVSGSGAGSRRVIVCVGLYEMQGEWVLRPRAKLYMYLVMFVDCI